MKEKFLIFLHSNLDCLIDFDCLNVPQIQDKARKLAQFRFQDCNYSCRSALFDAIVEYDSFLLRKFHDAVKVAFGY